MEGIVMSDTEGYLQTLAGSKGLGQILHLKSVI